MKNKGLLIAIVILIIGGIVYYKYQQKQTQSEPQAQISGSAENALSEIKNQAADIQKQASAEAKKLEQKATEIQQQAAGQAKQIQQEAANQADQIKTAANDLLAKANEYLNKGNYDLAIKYAQEILSKIDANSIDAKNIIETAKAKIKEVANQKLQEVKSMDTNKFLGDAKNKIGALGTK